MEIGKRRILAAFDLETTGLEPAVHDIIELVIVPLNPDFSRSELPEFVARIKAVHPENADPDFLRINGLNPLEGEDIDQVSENLVRWMTENCIDLIDPVAHNLPFDLRFFDAKFPALADIFSGCGRDSMQLAVIINDVALTQTGKKLFPNVGLQNLKAQFGMNVSELHRATADALESALLYRRLLQKLIINN